MSVAAYTAVAPTSVPLHRNHDFAVRGWIPPPILTAKETAAANAGKAAAEEVVLDILSTNINKKNRVTILAEAMAAPEQPERPPQPYVHPLLRQSSGLMSQRSLDICTENLGSETGSDGFFSACERDHYFTSSSSSKKISLFYIHGVKKEEWGEEEEEEAATVMDMQGRKKLTSVNYHRSTVGRFPRLSSFPPPLPSMSRRDGPCIQMRSHRRDGHLIVEAVAVPSHNYLHAERQGGRLRLSFVESFSKMHEEDGGEKEEDLLVESENVSDCEEEVEVRMKNKGTVVEFSVSMQPPPVITGSPKAKVRRSSLVINKFLVGPPQSFTTFDPPLTSQAAQKTAAVGPTSEAAAAAAAAAIAECSISTSTLDGFRCSDGLRHLPWEAMEWKLLFTSKRRSREELLHDVQRCSHLRWPLFIFEQPCCIATTT